MTIEESFKKIMLEAIQPLADEVRELRKKVNGTEQYGATLTKKDIMRRYQIKETKASEIMNRKDFPLMPGIGPAKVMLRHLEQWEDEQILIRE